jgi:hypothetical protein
MPMSAQERAPRHRPLTARRNTLFPQDLGDCRSGHPMAEVLERALDPRVAPARIVGRHPDRETAYLHLHAGSPRPRRRARPLSRDQRTVPPENRVRRDDRRDFRENPTAEAITDRGETPTFVVTQPHPPAVQLRLQYAVLCPEEIDDIALLPFKPAEQRRYDQVQRKHARSLRQRGVDAVFGHYGFRIAARPLIVRKIIPIVSRSIEELL